MSDPPSKPDSDETLTNADSRHEDTSNVNETQSPTDVKQNVTSTLPREPVCVLRATHYSISSSIGIDTSMMTPFIATLDTGSGFNLIRTSILAKDMIDYVNTSFTDPALADANGQPLRIEGVIILRIRLGNAMFPERFTFVPVWPSRSYSEQHLRINASKPFGVSTKGLRYETEVRYRS